MSAPVASLVGRWDVGVVGVDIASVFVGGILSTPVFVRHVFATGVLRPKVGPADVSTRVAERLTVSYENHVGLWTLPTAFDAHVRERFVETPSSQMPNAVGPRIAPSGRIRS